jgi:hypothetical protein
MPLTPEYETLTDEQISTRLSKAQQKTLEALKRDIWRNDTNNTYGAPVPWNTGDYEVKRWEVQVPKGEEEPSLVFLYSVIGRRSDEGTMAEVFARNKRMIAIGRRGGCRLLNAARFVVVKGVTKCVASKQKPSGVHACARGPTD